MCNEAVQRYLSTVALESDEAADQEDTQDETVARASEAEEDDYSSMPDSAVHDVAQAYDEVASGNGDYSDNYS